MNPHKYAFKNYIFDFYGTLVDIETDESSPILWDTMAQIYQSYGASYTGEGLRLRYKELVQQAEAEIAKDKQVAYPEIDLTVIFVQLYLEGHPSGNSVAHLKEWGRLIARTFRILSRKRLVIKEHQLNPEKTVMVGNDFTTDVAVAQSIGMESILINTFPYSEAELREKNQAGVRVIRDIQELQED